MFKNNCSHMSDLDLMRIVIPRGARELLAKHSLADMLLDSDFNQGVAATEAKHSSWKIQRLQAIRELMNRALVERMKSRENLTSPELVKQYLKVNMSKLTHEVFSVIYLNAQHQLISCVPLFRGTLTQTTVYPREIVKQALAYNAASVILAHNHPSGTPDPSRSDESLTSQVIDALRLVDIKVLDHFIVAGTHEPVSMREKINLF